MKIQVIKKGTVNAKPVTYCDVFVDDVPAAEKQKEDQDERSPRGDLLNPIGSTGVHFVLGASVGCNGPVCPTHRAGGVRFCHASDRHWWASSPNPSKWFATTRREPFP